MPEIYVNDPAELGLIGPFASKRMADRYMYDIKGDWNGFSLLESAELNGTEEIIAPEIEYLTLRIQVNRPKASRYSPREILEEGLDRWNDEMGSGPQFYIVEG